VAERGGYDLAPDLGYAPTNKYLPPRPRKAAAEPAPEAAGDAPTGLLRWVDRILSL